MAVYPEGFALSRRTLLKAGGALVVSFSMSGLSFAQEGTEEAQLPDSFGSLANDPMLDSWIRIDADGAVTVFTGKAELGQGIKTAITQVAAEELEVDPDGITLITADTAQTADEGYTAASHSMEESGTAIFHAAAQVRELLIGLAAAKLAVDRSELAVKNGMITGGGKSVGYGELVSGDVLHRRAEPQSKLKDPSTYTVIGKDIPRVDIPAKITGGPAYIQDFRPDGMVHARIVRPPNDAARLRKVEMAHMQDLPGFLKVVRDGNFLAVVTEGEFQAVQAMRMLSEAAEWDVDEVLPDEGDIHSVLRGLESEDKIIQDVSGPAAAAAHSLEATYRRPHQMHASIGPSCAVALFENGFLTVWSHTQGVYPDRVAIAELLGLDQDQVRVIHLEGAGCYGHNGADDAAADAAVIAHAYPGRPIRLQWMREHEHGWEPYGSAMIVEVSGAVDGDGNVVDWRYEVWSNPHSTRPGPAGNLIAGRLLANPFEPGEPANIPQPAGGGDRNAVPLYKFPNSHVVKHWISEMPIRVSAHRSLGAYMNVFALESFLDELAAAAEIDPVGFRLRHLDDQRAKDVVSKAAEEFGWSDAEDLPANHGRGFAFAQYKNLAAYCAVAMEVEVTGATGLIRPVRVTAACDSGQAVNPDGIRNQTEGGILQSISWTLYEAVHFSNTHITSRDWGSYPILRFDNVPDSVDVFVIDRPGQPFLGTGEAAQGPAAAALANAFADATGRRIRDLPFSRDKVIDLLRV